MRSQQVALAKASTQVTWLLPQVLDLHFQMPPAKRFTLSCRALAEKTAHAVLAAEAAHVTGALLNLIALDNLPVQEICTALKVHTSCHKRYWCNECAWWYQWLENLETRKASRTAVLSCPIQLHLLRQFMLSTSSRRHHSECRTCR